MKQYPATRNILVDDKRIIPISHRWYACDKLWLALSRDIAGFVLVLHVFVIAFLVVFVFLWRFYVVDFEMIPPLSIGAKEYTNLLLCVRVCFLLLETG